MVHTTLNIFLRNKTFLFLNIESWNFQHLFDLGFHKTLQISSHSYEHLDNILLWGIQVVRMSWNFVGFHEKKKSKRCLKFQISILTNKKNTMDSSFFSQQMAPWRPNFPNARLSENQPQKYEALKNLSLNSQKNQSS